MWTKRCTRFTTSGYGAFEPLHKKALLGFEPRISCLQDRCFHQLSHSASLYLMSYLSLIQIRLIQFDEEKSIDFLKFWLFHMWDFPLSSSSWFEVKETFLCSISSSVYQLSAGNKRTNQSSCCSFLLHVHFSCCSWTFDERLKFTGPLDSSLCL